MKYSRKIKRYLGFACLSMCVIIFVKELYAVSYWNTIANYFSDEGDALPSAEDPSFAPKVNNSIFFHDTSFRGELTAREACSVEAAARANPKREIYVLFSAPVTDYELKTGCLAKLLHFPNVKFLRVHVAEYSKGTVVHSIFLNDLKESRFPIQHTADILRMLTLNKWGGISVEFDMIVVKPLEDMPPNWIVKHGVKFVAPGILSLSKDEFGSNITSSILAEIFETYDPYDKFVTGRTVIQKVVQRMCPVRIRWDSCHDIAIYKHQYFYPMDKILWNANYKVRKFQASFSFQWNFFSRSRSPYNIYIHNEKLAKRYCPSIFMSYPKELHVL